MLSDDPEDLFELPALRNLASNLLCPRWHQGAKEEVVARKWYGELSSARKALRDLEKAENWGIDLQEERRALERRHRGLRMASEIDSDDESNTTSDDDSNFSDSSQSRSSSPPALFFSSVAAASSEPSSRRSSLSICSDEAPFLYDDMKN